MVRCERSEWYESASEARCRARRATPRWTAWILATLWSRFRRRQMRRRARPMSRAAKRCMPDRPAARPWAACRAFKTASAARTPSRMSSQNATCSRSAPRFLSRNSSSTASARASWLSVRSRLNQGTLPRGAACRAHFFCSSATTTRARATRRSKGAATPSRAASAASRRNSAAATPCRAPTSRQRAACLDNILRA